MTQNVAADRSGIDPIRGIRTSLSLSICTLLDGDGRCAPCSNCSIISRMWSGCWLQQQKADLTSVSLCSISIDLAAKRNYCVASLTIRQTGGDKRASRVCLSQLLPCSRAATYILVHVLQTAQTQVHTLVHIFAKYCRFLGSTP